MSLSRRSFLTSLAATGAMASVPARAEFNLQNVIGGAQQVIGAYASGEEDEIKMGRTYYKDYLAKSGGAYSDRNAQEALRRFATPLLGASDRSKLPWEVTLLKNDQVNAWALPGGKLAINSGLIRYAEHPAELASVLAHEIGHVDKGHGLSQVRTEAVVSTVGGLGKEALAGWLGGAAGGLGREALTALEGPLYTLILTGYSRQNEFEADHHILGIFNKTGMDPQRASDFFKTLMKVYPDSSQETTSLFSTHPGTQTRIERLVADSKDLARPGSTPVPKGWQELKALFPTPAGFRKG